MILCTHRYSEVRIAAQERKAAPRRQTAPGQEASSWSSPGQDRSPLGDSRLAEEPPGDGDPAPGRVGPPDDPLHPQVQRGQDRRPGVVTEGGGQAWVSLSPPGGPLPGPVSQTSAPR